MKNLHYLSVLLTLCFIEAVPVTAQKKVSELTLVYDYSVGSAGSEPKQPGANESATYTVYIKGNKSRSEMNNALFSSTIIFDANTGSGVILKEVSGQKLLIRLTPDNWQEKNKLYEGVVFQNTTETKEIAGYKCVKAVGQTKAGITITVYYTRDILPDNKEYDPAFKSLSGLPLEYELTLTNGDVKIKYVIAKINLNPVPASKFDIPKGGYRELPYEDSKKT